MKKILAFAFLLILSLPISALENGQAMYVGGTSPLDRDVVGRLNIASESLLGFEYSEGKLVIPYAAIQSFEYSREVTHHLGVLPAIAVGLVKRRQRRHFFRISYYDESRILQVAIFEVPKQMPRVLQSVLETRAPQGCGRTPCGLHK
jgi:hypothetical protein